MELLSGLFSRRRPPTFVEREPWERGFAHIFARDLAPQFVALETWRRLSLASVAVAVMLSGITYFIGFSGIMFVFGPRPQSTGEALMIFSLFIVTIMMGLPLVGGYYLESRFIKRVQPTILETICKVFGSVEVSAIDPRGLEAVLDPYLNLDLIPKSQTLRALWLQSPAAVFIGSHRGISLWLAQVDVGQLRSVLFRGTLIELSLPDFGPGKPYSPRHFDQLDLPDLDQELPGAPASATLELKQLRTPEIARGLLRLAAAFQPSTLSGAVLRTRFYIAMPRIGWRRPFDVVRLWTSLNRCEPAIRRALAQLAAVLAVVDAVADVCAEPIARAPGGSQQDDRHPVVDNLA